MREPTINQVRAYAAKHEVGLMEARRVLVRECLVKDLDDASTVEDLKAIIRRII
ncbi:hypothetical protein IB276_33130 [Ensifer sp. ENS04]|uniref:hypothetical protein n=1 Tax=Ensifer sp. ENS04 TaxID=2769281 RepID=UPI00177FE41B|nr:hypothetical protein [Ensifer sp. ENS04]MBD9544291.1 hypothetical protein [Ensifer sp. ENS04]